MLRWTDQAHVSLHPSSHRHCALALSLLFLGLLLLPMEMAVASEPQPITVRSHIYFDRLPNQSVPIIRLTDPGVAEENVITVNWEMTQSGWFPVWQLVVRSDSGLIPVADSLRTSPVSPTAGHTYEVKLSYDPHSGALALSLMDVTTGESLLTHGWHIQSYGASIDASELTGVELISASPWFEPLDLKWEIGSFENGDFVPLKVIEPSAANQLRLTTVARLPGEFQVISEEGHAISTHVIDRSGEGRLFLELPEDALPSGERVLELRYVEDGIVRFADARQIQVGRVHVDVRPASFDRDAGVIDVFINLSSDSPLSNLDVELQATVTQLVWNATLLQYEEQVNAAAKWQETVPIVPLEGTKVVAQLPAPEQPGIWRIDVTVTPSPAVDVRYVTRNAYVSTYEPAVIEEGDTFVIAVLPDTQYYAKTYHDIYMRQTEWLSRMAAERNIALALHVGDITEDNTPSQWQVARAAHSLLDGVVPYVLSVGNHDYAISGLVAARHTSMVNEYFSLDDFPLLVDTMEPGRLENTFHAFSVGNTDYLIVSLEFAPPDEALAWANDVVAKHPGHRVIVLTHGYLHPARHRLASGASARVFPMGENPATTMNDGDDIWRKFVSHHENIVMVLSGHIHSDAIPYRTSVGRYGNVVHEMLANFQAAENGGNGFLVLLEVTPDDEVHVSAYSPYLDEVKTGSDRHGNMSRRVLQFVQ